MEIEYGSALAEKNQNQRGRSRSPLHGNYERDERTTEERNPSGSQRFGSGRHDHEKNTREQRSWPTPEEAKQAIAAFALQTNENMVEPVRRSDAGTIVELAAEQRPENRSQKSLGEDHLDRERMDEQPEVDEILVATRVALACIRSTVGRNRGIPDDVVQNAQLARGFVMGFEYGSSLVEEDQSQRDWSRSPASGGRRFGVDRHDHGILTHRPSFQTISPLFRQQLSHAPDRSSEGLNKSRCDFTL